MGYKIKLSTKIYGVKERESMMRALQSQLNLNDEDIFFDDRPFRGMAYYTARKAWMAPFKEEETHRLVFPEDMIVCNNFYDNVYQILQNHPDKVISLLVMNYFKKEWAKNLTTPYTYSYFCYGNGIIIPRQYIRPMIEWIDQKYKDKIDFIADDIAITEWLQLNKIPIISTVPNLVEHIGDISIEDERRPIRRSFYFEENPQVDWNNNKIQLLTSPNFSREKIINKLKNG